MDSPLDWISETELARLAGAHPLTARRWKREGRRGRVATWLARLVNTVHRGQLDELHQAWRGWLINQVDGELVSPEGVRFRLEQIRALPVLLELRHALEAELRALRLEIAKRTTIPGPASWYRKTGTLLPDAELAGARLQERLQA